MLTDPAPVVPAREVLALCVEASGVLGPWLDAWQAQTDPVADRHLTEAVAHSADQMEEGRLPWDVLENEDHKLAGLTAWLVRHGLDRLRTYGATGELLDRIRLLGLSRRADVDEPSRPDSGD